MKLISSISVIQGEWTVEEVVQQATEESVDDEPFYVMDLGEVVQRYQCWRNLMPRVEPFYAVKCHEDKMLLRTLAALGAGFDCASRQEIDLVTGIGVSPERIIYAHTTKMASHVRHAERIGVTTTTFDSDDELIKIKDIMPHAKLVLRIRCDAKLAHVSLGTKFGCDPIAEAPQLLKMASHLGLKVIGVSFHVGSGAKEFGAYARGVRHCAKLFKLGEAFGFEMRLVDIGGGYPGDLQSSIHEVSAVVNKALERYFPDDSVRVIAEPGQYFACAAYTLAACVFAKRQACNGKRESSSLWGPTCDGLDCVLPSILLPPLPVGSWLLFRNMGAYTRSIATTFHGFPKAKIQYIVDRSKWSILKDSQLFSDVDFEYRLLTSKQIRHL